MPLTTLPDGLVLEAPTANEARIIHRELFVECPYLRNGVEVHDGATVLDVGANIGAFSVLLGRRHDDLRIIAFEPIPDTFAMLESNAARHLAGAEVTLVEAGVGAAAGRAQFHVFPSSSFVATTDPAASASASASVRRSDGGTLAWARALLEDAERVGFPPRIARALGAGLGRRRARRLLLAALVVVGNVLTAVRRLRTKQVDCRMTTISETLRDHAIDAVDLVKIDVEGGEWSVLEGIDDEHWPRLRQLVLEVHDVDGRVDKICSLLRQRGFDVVVEQEEWATLRLLGLHNVYAVRPQANGVTPPDHPTAGAIPPDAA